MVRRLKSELPPKWDGSPRFPKRVLEPIEVPYTDEERADPRRPPAVHRTAGRAVPGQRREVGHRVRPQDAEEAALLQPGRLPDHAGPAREVAATAPSGARPSASRPSASSSGRLDRIDEDYADDDEYDEATTDAVDAATPAVQRAVRRGTGPAQADEGRGRRRASAQLDSKAKGLIAG